MNERVDYRKPGAESRTRAGVALNWPRSADRPQGDENCRDFLDDRSPDDFRVDADVVVE